MDVLRDHAFGFSRPGTVSGDSQRAPAGIFDLLTQTVRLLFALVVVYRHRSTMACHMTADGAADPARAAGHQGHMAVQIKHEMRRRERRADRVILASIPGSLF